MSEDPLIRKLALYSVPVLLCLTAGTQRFMAASHDLNPWKGGGYGMFSDIHRTHYRVIALKPVDENNIGYVITVPKLFERDMDATRALPTTSRLEALGERLLQQEWFLAGPPGNQFPIIRQQLFRHPGAKPVKLKGMTVQLAEPAFDAKSNQMTCTVVKSVQVSGGQ